MKTARWYGTAKKLICYVFALVILLNCTPVFRAEEYAVKTENQVDTVTLNNDNAEKNYRQVKKGYTFKYFDGEDLSFNAVSAVIGEAETVADAPDYSGSAVKLIQGSDAEFTFSVPQNALYRIAIEYYDASDSTLPVNCNVAIDGMFHCYEMRNQQFESEWKFETEVFGTDRYGNEIVPESVRINQWKTKYFSDASAITMDPFWFQLEAGTHSIKFHCSQGSILIGKIIISGEETVEYGKTGTPEGDGCYIIEGERFAYKNSASIRPTGEYDASVVPYDYTKLKLNMLSGGSFADGGQSVTYSFEAEKSGYYYLGFKYRQSSKTDFPVFRYLYIDGKLYNESFKNVAFDYSRGFTTMTVEDSEGNPVGVYFDKGSHTISLTVSLENMADIIDDVNTLISEINDMSLQIMKVTGNNTSVYRDFDVLAYLPTIQDDLKNWADRIEALYNRLAEFAPEVKTVGEYSTLKICVKQLRSLAEDINDLPTRINELYQGDSSVGQYLANTLESLYTSPLAIDQVYVYQDKEKLPEKKGFFYKIGMSVCRFISSFTSDYYSSSSNEDGEHLQVWINRSRLYVELMQKMADDSFFEQSGLAVDISLMPNEEKLVLASASGNAPDVAMGVTYTIPFELAVRGAVKELSSYPDWNEVASRFGKGIMNIGAMNGGYYLLPETSDFLVLFYRQDILDELGLSVPDTMNDVKEMLPVLKRYGMDFYSHIAGHGGTKSLSVLVPFIYQMNGRVYGETANDLLITSEGMVNAFKEMSNLFTIYDIPYEVSNFYQHFRSGSIPIGISGFNTYMTLLNSAPEIANSWSVAPYPGYLDENGNVLRYISGAQSTAVIFESTEYEKESWEFLKWWTSTEIQSQFAEILRLTYGNEYMWNTANLEAFEKLPWNEQHKETILEMLDWIVEVPRVPGNYMTQRSLSNALNNIILHNGNVRQELAEASKDIKVEIASKLEEFGYMKGAETIKDYKIPKQEGYYEKR